MRKPKRKQLHVESLENRQLMAGDFVAFAHPAAVAGAAAEAVVERTRHYSNCSRRGCEVDYKDTLKIEGTEQADTIRVDRVNVVTSSRYNYKTGRYESVYQPRIRVQVTNESGTMTRHFDPAQHDLAEIEIDAKGGSDTVHQNAPYTSKIRGGHGHDRLYGGPMRDEIFGDYGNDYLYGQDGNDFLDGGAGSDHLFGQGGNDQIRGGAGIDRMFGGSGHDRMWGDSGNDYISGANGNDYLDGGDGADTLSGGHGNDRLQGGNSGDVIYGNSGNDSLYGGAGSDRLYGNSGHDWLYGQDGYDTLRGGDGDDVLSGGRDIDSLQGENGRNMLLDEGVRPRLRVGNDFVSNYESHLRTKYGPRLGDFWSAMRAAFNGPERKGVVIMGHKFNVKPFTVARFGNRTEIRGQFSHSKPGPDDQFYYTLKFKDGEFVDFQTNIRGGGLLGIVRTVRDVQSAWMRFSGIVTPWSFNSLTVGIDFPDVNPANRVGFPQSQSNNGIDVPQLESNNEGWKAAAELLMRSIAALAYVGG